MDRTKEIVRASMIGIGANVLLAAFKAVIGILSHSIAITLDAVNNLSDAMSSLITMIGAKPSFKEPDRKHPYGYGRIEYLSTLAIAVIITYAGITSFIEAIQKLISPASPYYNTVSLAIILVAVFVKIALGLFTKKAGEKYDSDSLVASGKDSLNDSIISTSTLVVAIIFIMTGLNLEAFVGLIISAMILKTGLETLHGTISELLGERIPAELSKAVKNSANSFPEVEGVYDLVIHDYGKARLLASAHIEVAESMTAAQLDPLERKITEKVFRDTGVAITALSVYSSNATDCSVQEAKAEIKKVLSEYKDVMQMHGFYKDNVEKYFKFDIVVNFDAPNKKALRDEIAEKIKKIYPEYDVDIAIDYDYSD